MYIFIFIRFIVISYYDVLMVVTVPNTFDDVVMVMTEHVVNVNIVIR